MQARISEGIGLGKPKGVVQASLYDKDEEKILHPYKSGVLIQKIIATHLVMASTCRIKHLLTS